MFRPGFQALKGAGATNREIPQFRLTGSDRRALEFGGATPRVIAVGRRAGCEVALTNPSASELHACLVRRTDGVWVHDLDSRNGTYVNRKPVRERPLRDGDRLSFGDTPYVFKMSGRAGEEVAPARATLTTVATGETHHLPHPVTLVGRRGRSQLHLDGDEVSRTHCLLVRVGEGLLVHDLGSRTGTLVNGERQREALLRGGERLTIGRWEFEVTVTQASGATEKKAFDALLGELAASGKTGSPVAQEPSPGAGAEAVEADEPAAPEDRSDDLAVAEEIAAAEAGEATRTPADTDAGPVEDEVAAVEEAAGAAEVAEAVETETAEPIAEVIEPEAVVPAAPVALEKVEPAAEEGEVAEKLHEDRDTGVPPVATLGDQGQDAPGTHGQDARATVQRRSRAGSEAAEAGEAEAEESPGGADDWDLDVLPERESAEDESGETELEEEGPAAEPRFYVPEESAEAPAEKPARATWTPGTEDLYVPLPPQEAVQSPPPSQPAEHHTMSKRTDEQKKPKEPPSPEIMRMAEEIEARSRQVSEAESRAAKPAAPLRGEGTLSIRPTDLRPARPRHLVDEEASAEASATFGRSAGAAAAAAAASAGEELQRLSEQRRIAREVEALRRELASERDSIAAQKAALEAMKVERLRFDREREAHEESVRQFESDRRRLDEERAAQTEFFKSLEKEQDELKELRHELNATRARLETERELLDDERRQLEDLRDATRRDQESVRQEREQLAAERGALKGESEQIELLREDFARRQKEIDEGRAALDDRLRSVEDEAAQISADREAVRRHREEVEADRRRLALEESQLQQDREGVDGQAARLAELRSEVERREAALSARQREVDDRAGALEEQMERHAASVASFQETVASAQAAEAMADRMADELSSKAEEVEAPAEPTAAEAAAETRAESEADEAAAVAEMIRAAELPTARETAKAAVLPDRKSGRRAMTIALAVVALVVAVVVGRQLLLMSPKSPEGGSAVVPLVPTVTSVGAGGGAETQASAEMAETTMAVAAETSETAKAPETAAAVETSAAAETSVAPETSAAIVPETSPAAESGVAAETSVAPETAAAPETNVAVEAETVESATAPDTSVAAETAAAATTNVAAETGAKVEPIIPGGVWPYAIPRDLTAGPAADLRATLEWARKDLEKSIGEVRRAYGLEADAGPLEAIAMRPSDGLVKALERYLPPPFMEERLPTGKAETTSAIVFLEFRVKGNPYLFVMKRIEETGATVAGRRGTFVLVPGDIQEHTVVLDPTMEAIPEPFRPE